MQIELEKKLNELVYNGKIDEAILIAEKELLYYPENNFHKVIGHNLSHLINELNTFLEYFYESTKEKTSIKAIYCEMNGFTINYDLWFINLFGYNKNQDLDDIDWLGDYDIMFDFAMTITGFEELQSAYKDYMKNKKWNIENLENQSNICELLIILRLQELFKSTKEVAEKQNLNWIKIPIYVTAHDYEMIYKL